MRKGNTRRELTIIRKKKGRERERERERRISSFKMILCLRKRNMIKSGIKWSIFSSWKF